MTKKYDWVDRIQVVNELRNFFMPIYEHGLENSTSCNELTKYIKNKIKGLKKINEEKTRILKIMIGNILYNMLCYPNSKSYLRGLAFMRIDGESRFFFICSKAESDLVIKYVEHGIKGREQRNNLREREFDSFLGNEGKTIFGITQEKKK